MPRGIWKNGKDLQMRKNPGGMGVPASGIIASRDAVARTWRPHPARVTVAGEVEGVTWERRTGSASQPRRSVFILGRRGAAEGCGEGWLSSQRARGSLASTRRGDFGTAVRQARRRQQGLSRHGRREVARGPREQEGPRAQGPPEPASRLPWPRRWEEESG